MLFVAVISIAVLKFPEAKIHYLLMNHAVISRQKAALAGDFWGEIALFSP
jgi:hypothetical protein